MNRGMGGGWIQLDGWIGGHAEMGGERNGWMDVFTSFLSPLKRDCSSKSHLRLSAETTVSVDSWMLLRCSLIPHTCLLTIITTARATNR